MLASLYFIVLYVSLSMCENIVGSWEICMLFEASICFETSSLMFLRIITSYNLVL